jgi:Sigma-70 region 2
LSVDNSMQRSAGGVRQSGVTGVMNELTVSDDLATDTLRRQLVADLHARHGQPLWGFVRRLGLADAEAEDVVQEALLRLYVALGAGAQIAQPAAWMYRTAHHLAMDRHRLRRRWQALRERLAPRDPPPPELRDEALAVWSEVDRLPERQRQGSISATGPTWPSRRSVWCSASSRPPRAATRRAGSPRCGPGSARRRAR